MQASLVNWGAGDEYRLLRIEIWTRRDMEYRPGLEVGELGSVSVLHGKEAILASRRRVVKTCVRLAIV